MVTYQKGYFCYADIEGILQIYCYDTNGFTKDKLFRYFAEYIFNLIPDTIKNVVSGKIVGIDNTQGIYTAMFETGSKTGKIPLTLKQVNTYTKLLSDGLEVSVFLPYFINVGTYKFFQTTTFQYPVFQDKVEYLKLVFTPDKDMVRNIALFIEEEENDKQVFDGSR